jgi:hypothetical protein
MSKSNYAENAVLDWVLGGSTPTRPSARYLALYTSDPGEADGGTEVSGGSYARQAVTFDAASGGATANSGLIQFPGMPACTVTHFGIRTASSGGNLLYSGALSSSKVVNAGDTFEVAVGDLDVSED